MCTVYLDILSIFMFGQDGHMFHILCSQFLDPNRNWVGISKKRHRSLSSNTAISDLIKVLKTLINMILSLELGGLHQYLLH